VSLVLTLPTVKFRPRPSY